MNPPRPLSREEDAFWTVALDNGDDSFPKERKYDRFSARTCVYELALPEPYGTLRCPLAHLPLPFGTERSTGAQAWYGSALLSALFLQTSDDEIVRIQRHICAYTDRSGTSDLSILELGSGAVGLSGIVAGFAMLAHLRTASARAEEAISCRVFLTDRDAPVLQQLEQNLRCNEVQWMKQFPKWQLPEFVVQSLHWEDGWKGREPQLVIGSELVYNTATATACAHMVRQLLDRSPDVWVILVQVAHRDGWSDVFLPTVRRAVGVAIHEHVPAPELQDIAGRARRDPRSADRFHPLSHLQSSG
jgi:Lysine methyltransferase